MRCGAKRYIVTYEEDGARKAGTVTARTPAEARKAFRRARGTGVTILSVIEAKAGAEVSPAD